MPAEINPELTPMLSRVCLYCGAELAPEAKICPECNRARPSLAPSTTHRVKRQPQLVPAPGDDLYQFDDDALLVLQVLPSGICLTASLKQPLVLGRLSAPQDPQKFLDLSSFSAYQHGVSRQHCRLLREESRLFVVDMGSSNGTHVNETRLSPHVPALIGHGDRLILGTLHLAVSFNKIQVTEV